MTTLIALTMAAGAVALLAAPLRAVAPRSATLALLAVAASGAVTGTVWGGDVTAGAALVVSAVVVWWWWPRRHAFPRAVATAAGLAAIAATARGSAEPWIAVLWGAGDGLAFWMPVAWAAVAGLLLLARHERWTAVTLAGGIVLVLALAAGRAPGAEAGLPGPRFAALLPLLAVPLARGLEALRGAAARHPGRVVAVPGVLLVAWNMLLMQQYRDLLIPRDDTMAFPRALENGARMVSAHAGAPPAWPGAWLAAAGGVPVARVEALVPRTVRPGHPLTVRVAEPAEEDALLGPGWSVRRRCGDALCREVEGRADVLLRLARPLGVTVTVDAMQGELAVLWNGAAACMLSLPAQRTCAVPAGRTVAGVNHLSLEARAPVLVRALAVAPEDRE